ncbi:MAG: 50S ribosomal protein L10 [Candidatus Ryanbacteria bacterium]|nr:50S ribosomal protein L10 [Candidatus Ryanbacteria bacterium]
MPITRTKKHEIVKELKDKMQKAKSLVFARFHGVSVAKISEFRRRLKQEDSEYMVAKKTLIKIALKETGKDVSEEFEGEVGMLAGYGDELGLWRQASDFAKKEKGAFEVLGGFFEGKYVDKETARRLGMIPSREALIAQFMSVLLGNTRKFLYILDQLKNKKSA